MSPPLSVLLLFGLSFLPASISYAGDVNVTVVTTTGAGEKPATTFTADAPNILAVFKTKGISAGDKIRGVLIAEDVGDVAPPDTKVLESKMDLDQDTEDGGFTFSKPSKGWPPGKYRIVIYVNDEAVAKSKFTVEGAVSKKQEAGKVEGSDGVPDEAQLKSMTESSLVSFGNAVKKKDFSELYEEIAPIWQKQTSPKKLEDDFKQFYGKDIDLPAAIKGKEPIFNRPAAIDSKAVLTLQGYYPTTPSRIVFQLKYLRAGEEWQLLGIDVNLKE